MICIHIEIFKGNIIIKFLTLFFVTLFILLKGIFISFSKHFDYVYQKLEDPATEQNIVKCQKNDTYQIADKLHICSTGCTSSPKFPIPRGCFPEDKWSESQRIACPISQRIGPLILWDSGHPLGNGTLDTWDTLSSGIRTIYPLGNILWESGSWEQGFNSSTY